jgi:ferredoxin
VQGVRSPFEILQVDPDADDDEIDRAYRRRVLETHPDQGGSARELQSVRTAYEEIRSGTESETPESIVESRDGGSGDDVADPDADAQGPEGTRVEYLNFEVLDDHGWDLGDEDLFEKASAAGLDHEDYGLFLADPGEYLLEAAENRGFAWPYACRGGACANCAVAVVEGELETPGNHILSAEWIERDIRLSCMSTPVSDDLKVVYNVKHLPGLDELRLPAHRFEAQFND